MSRRIIRRAIGVALFAGLLASLYGAAIFGDSVKWSWFDGERESMVLAPGGWQAIWGAGLATVGIGFLAVAVFAWKRRLAPLPAQIAPFILTLALGALSLTYRMSSGAEFALMIITVLIILSMFLAFLCRRVTDAPEVVVTGQ